MWYTLCMVNKEPTKGDTVNSTAVITTVEICGCTNAQLERGETCGQDNCPTK